ncbi:MAG TPA: aminoglycoside phosphotransferase family protein [Microlunatus sp.]
MSRFLEVGRDRAAALIGEQFPQWADLPLTRVEPGGSDHVIYRLGDVLSARFPRHAGAVDQARHEARWLPRLAPQLPLAIPQTLAIGEPSRQYPWHWAVHRWLEGDAVTPEEYGDSIEAAQTLAAFTAALRSFPVDGSAPPIALPLVQRDEVTRHNITLVSQDFDAVELTRIWDAGLAAPPWRGDPVWYHGDFHTGNLLATDHQVTAVIDFGGLGVGDPANDLMMAFTLFSPAPRAVFRDALETDDATWGRSRAWALTTGLTAYTAYAATHPAIKRATTRQILAAVEG